MLDETIMYLATMLFMAFFYYLILNNDNDDE